MTPITAVEYPCQRPQESSVCVAATAGVHDDFDSASCLAGPPAPPKKPQRAATDVWTTAVHFSKSFPCNHRAGQRVSPERDEKGDLSEEDPNMLRLSRMSRHLNSI